LADAAQKTKKRSAARRSLPRLAAGLSLAAFVGACASLLGIEKPEVSLANIEPGEINAFEQRFVMGLRIVNPNDFSIDLDGLVVRAKLNDRKLATGVSDEPIPLPRLGSATVRLETSTTTLDWIAQLPALVSAGDLSYAIEGHTYYVGESGRIKIPFSKEGALGE